MINQAGGELIDRLKRLLFKDPADRRKEWRSGKEPIYCPRCGAAAVPPECFRCKEPLSA